jgi:hypothetical protein
MDERDSADQASFHYLYYHGHEQRDSSAAAALAVQTKAEAPMTLHMANYAVGLCNHVNFCINGDDQAAEQVAKVLASSAESPTLFTVDASLIKGEQDAEVIMRYLSRPHHFPPIIRILILVGHWWNNLARRLWRRGMSSQPATLSLRTKNLIALLSGYNAAVVASAQL